MKQLTNVDELIGKTIKSTYGLFDENEEIVIVFNDSFVILNMLRWDEAAGIGIDEDPIDPRLAKQAGLITKEECDRLIEEERKMWVTRQEETNIELLKRLMESYPDVVAGR